MRCTPLRRGAVHCAALHCTPAQSTAPHSTAPYSTASYSNALHSTALRRSPLRRTPLHPVLHCAPHSTASYSTVLTGTGDGWLGHWALSHFDLLVAAVVVRVGNNVLCACSPGTLGDFQNMKKLREVHFNDNKLTGELPGPLYSQFQKPVHRENATRGCVSGEGIGLGTHGPQVQSAAK